MPKRPPHEYPRGISGSRPEKSPPGSHAMSGSVNKILGIVTLIILFGLAYLGWAGINGLI